MLELLPLVCQACQDFADLGRVFVPLLDQPVALRAHLHKARIIKKGSKDLLMWDNAADVKDKGGRA